MKRILMSLTMLMAISSLSIANAATLAAAPAAAKINPVAVTGPVTGGGTFAGELNITKFVAEGGKILAIGNLTGAITGATDAAKNTAIPSTPVKMPVTTGAHTCEILTLTLGPLSLNLLGLNVDLSQVNLDITAESGSGNLLGNLLCSIAKLLDGNGAVNGIVGLLNNILRQVG